MFKYRSAEVAWPEACVGCGTTEIDGGETFQHKFKAESTSEIGGSRSKKSASATGTVYLCEGCLRVTKEAAEQDIAEGSSGRQKGYILAGIALAFGFLVYPMTILLPMLSSISGPLLGLGILVAWLGFSFGMIPQRKEKSGSEVLVTPFKNYISLGSSGNLFVANHVFLSIFKQANSVVQAYHMNLAGTAASGDKLANFGQGCCLSISIVIISVMLFNILFGLV